MRVPIETPYPWCKTRINVMKYSLKYIIFISISIYIRPAQKTIGFWTTWYSDVSYSSLLCIMIFFLTRSKFLYLCILYTVDCEICKILGKSIPSATEYDSYLWCSLFFTKKYWWPVPTGGSRTYIKLILQQINIQQISLISFVYRPNCKALMDNPKPKREKIPC